MLQVKYQSNISSYENIHESKTYKSDYTNTCRGKKKYMKNKIIKIRSILQFNLIMINSVSRI